MVIGDDGVHLCTSQSGPDCAAHRAATGLAIDSVQTLDTISAAGPYSGFGDIRNRFDAAEALLHT